MKITGGSVDPAIVRRTIDGTVKILVPADATQNVRASAGSAFIIPSESSNTHARLALTCYHVVANTPKVKVEIPRTKTQVDATVRSILPEHDLALISFVLNDNIDGGRLQPLELGNSNSLTPGDDLFVVGYPLGSDVKFTAGHVSGWESQIGSGGRIQTDTAVNPGNSGGPLLSKDGTVVGVVDSKLVKEGVASVAFGVPIEVFRQFAREMTPATGKVSVVRAPAFGLCLEPVADAVMKYADVRGGLRVTTVYANSGASANGVQVGDMLLSIDGKSIDRYGCVEVPWSTQPVPATEIMARSGNNDELMIETLRVRFPDSSPVVRAMKMLFGKETPRKLFLKKTNVLTGALQTMYPPYEPIETISLMGMTITPLRRNFVDAHPTVQALYMKLTPSERQAERLIVMSLLKDSDAAKQGIVAGATILKFNGQKIRSLDDLTKAAGRPLGGRLLKMDFWVRGGEKELSLDVGDAMRKERLYTTATRNATSSSSKVSYNVPSTITDVWTTGLL